MAFILDSERLFSGGLNLQPPGDLVPPGENLSTANWRADQQGSLRARRRDSLILTGPYTAPITTLWILASAGGGRFRYVGDATSLFIGTALIATGFDGKRLGLVPYQRNVWVMNQSLQGRSTGGTNWSTWGPAAPIAPVPTAVAPLAAGRTGDYEYYVTYLTAEGFESNLSPGATITLTAHDASLVIPVSADPTVVWRRIYRTGGTQVQLLMVGEVLDNTTTVFVDSMTDLAAEELGITHTGDHDDPPAAKGLIGPYFDRLIAYNSVAFPNRFWWTEQSKPSYFPGSDAAEGNWAPVGDDGEEIVRIVQRPGMILFYKTRSIWRCIGDPGSDGIIEQIATKLGLISDAGLAEGGPLDYFDTQFGVYECNGDQCKKVSPKLDMLFLQDATDNPGVQLVGISTDPAARKLGVMALRHGLLWFSYVSGRSTVADTTLVYDIALDQWTSDDRAWTALYDEGQPDSLVGAKVGTADVSIVESGTTGPIQVDLMTRVTDQSKPNNPKTYADLVIVSNLAGDALLVEAIYDFGAGVEALGVVSSTGGRQETILQFNGGQGTQARSIAIHIRGTLWSEGIIYSAHLHYQVEQRDGLTFDTSAIALASSEGPFQPGTPSHVKEVSAFAADIQTQADVTWSFYADLPSGLTELQLAPGTLPHLGVGRRSVQAALDLPGNQLPEGKLFRLLLTSTLPFRVYSLQFLCRRLGVYLVALQGYHTRELPLADSRIGLLKKLEIDARIETDILAVEISTDLPDGMKSRMVTTFPPGVPVVGSVGLTYPRQWLEMRLPSNTRGRYVKVDIDAAVTARLYSARLWVKKLGDAGASQWEWMALPIEASEEAFQWVSVGVDVK